MIVERVGRDELEFEGMIHLDRFVLLSGSAFLQLGLGTLDLSRPTRPMAKSLSIVLPGDVLPVRSDLELVGLDEAAGWSPGVRADSFWTVNRRRLRVRSVCIRSLSVIVRKARARVDGELSLALTPGRRSLGLSISKSPSTFTRRWSRRSTSSSRVPED